MTDKKCCNFWHYINIIAHSQNLSHPPPHRTHLGLDQHEKNHEFYFSRSKLSIGFLRNFLTNFDFFLFQIFIVFIVPPIATGAVLTWSRPKKKIIFL